MKDIKEFLRFLQQNKIMRLFINNLLTVRHATTWSILNTPEVKDKSKKGKVMAYLKSEEPAEFLQRSFEWQGSPEGDRYWRDISSQWRKQLHNGENNYIN